MGRCTFRFRPRFYTFVPMFNDDDTGANVQYDGLASFLPFRSTGDGPAPAGVRCVQTPGAVLSCTEVNNTSGDAAAYPMSGQVTARSGLAAHRAGPPTGASNPHWGCVYRWALTASEAAGTAEGYLEAGPQMAARGNWVRGAVGGASEDWDGLSGVMILSGAGEWWFDPTAGQGAVPIQYDPGGITHDPGPVTGGLTVFPIPTVDTHSAATAVRKIIAPVDMRVHGVTLTCETSGAGNGLKLAVGSDDITPVVAFTAGTFESKNVWGTGGDAQFAAGAYRDIKAGDVIELVKSGTNAMTCIQASIICSPQSHFNHNSILGGADYRRDYDDYPSPRHAPSNSRSNSELHGGVSGPAAGACAFIPLGQFNLAASQSGVTMASVKLPFDCEILAFICANRETIDSSATHRATLENSTQSTVICTSDDMYNYYSYTYYNSGLLMATWHGTDIYAPALANVSCNADDVLVIKGTTGVGETFDQAQAGVYVRVTGFPSQSPLYD